MIIDAENLLSHSFCFFLWTWKRQQFGRQNGASTMMHNFIWNKMGYNFCWGGRWLYYINIYLNYWLTYCQGCVWSTFDIVNITDPKLFTKDAQILGSVLDILLPIQLVTYYYARTRLSRLWSTLNTDAMLFTKDAWILGSVSDILLPIQLVMYYYARTNQLLHM